MINHNVPPPPSLSNHRDALLSRVRFFEHFKPRPDFLARNRPKDDNHLILPLLPPYRSVPMHTNTIKPPAITLSLFRRPP